MRMAEPEAHPLGTTAEIVLPSGVWMRIRRSGPSFGGTTTFTVVESFGCNDLFGILYLLSTLIAMSVMIPLGGASSELFFDATDFSS